MPILSSNNKYYDFEELFFEKNCDIDFILNSFFTKFKDDIKSDTEYISYKIKNLIEQDRKLLMTINGDGQDPLNRIGKISYIGHPVIPENNNGKEHFVYCVHSFI